MVLMSLKLYLACGCLVFVILILEIWVYMMIQNRKNPKILSE